MTPQDWRRLAELAEECNGHKFAAALRKEAERVARCQVRASLLRGGDYVEGQCIKPTGHEGGHVCDEVTGP